jgi:hypothetical protein
VFISCNLTYGTQQSVFLPSPQETVGRIIVYGVVIDDVALRPKQYTPPAPLQQTLHNQPGITYAQVTKTTTTCTPTPQDTTHLPTQSQQPLGDNQDLKLLLKTIIEQNATMLNLLNAVLSKLP